MIWGMFPSIPSCYPRRTPKFPPHLSRLSVSCILAVCHLSLSPPLVCFLGRHSAALGGPISLVPLARITPRKVIPTIVAIEECERVHLTADTVPCEPTPLLELGFGTNSALDLLNRPACPVIMCRDEECLVLGLESFWA
jgi:hypothetical protein